MDSTGIAYGVKRMKGEMATGACGKLTNRKKLKLKKDSKKYM